MDRNNLDALYRNNKGQFIKGYKSADLPIEYRIKKTLALSKAWEKSEKYIGDLKNEYPCLFNSWRAILYTQKGKKAGVSDEWRDFKTFVKDVLPTYKKGLVFRRIDTNKPFSKTNFIWCTKDEATLIRSNLCWMEYNGEILPLKQIADKYNVSLYGLKIRYHKRDKMNYTSDEIVFGRKVKRGSKKNKDMHDKDVIIRCKASKMIASYRLKDKRMGVVVTDIDVDWLIENILTKPCVYCGDIRRIGCDRLDNSKGHTKDNVVPSCIECNTARSNNFTFDEMKVIGKSIRKIKKDRKLAYKETCKKDNNND